MRPYVMTTCRQQTMHVHRALRYSIATAAQLTTWAMATTPNMGHSATTMEMRVVINVTAPAGIASVPDSKGSLWPPK